MTTAPSHDRPLSRAATVMLQIGAAATILLFYLFVLLSVCFLLIVLAIEFIVLLALLRFGMSRLFMPVMNKHGELLWIFLRSLWLGKGSEYRITLRPDDAPGLFTLLGTVCAKAKVPLPHKVYLEMGVNAWVRLRGFRRGTGTTHLGMGYDLLAGLSQQEFEGVLAHEMMHAKLVQRGVSQLLMKGVNRAAKLSRALGSTVAGDRDAKKSVLFVATFQHSASFLTGLAARQMAACSRQDEFVADIGAAELCGANALRSALLKLDDLERVASRLPLRDRIAQLESGESFEAWLLRELAAAKAASPAETKAEIFNQYSTHPSMHDRIAALASFPDQPREESDPAIRLLANPDQVAIDLVAAIQKELVNREREDSRLLDRQGRKTRTTRNVTPMRFSGIVLVLGGICSLIFSLIYLSIEPLSVTLIFIVLGLAAIPLGVWLHRMGKYKDTITLPVPDYALIKAFKKGPVTDEEIKIIETELIKEADAVKKKKRAALYLNHSYAALGECNYLRAHIAARLCLGSEKKSVPGHLALAIATAGLNPGPTVGQALRFVQQQTGLQSESITWGAGWALALAGDWMYAEIFLVDAHAKKPSEPTILALLAVSQLRRGKLFSAIDSARQAHQLQPDRPVYTKLLIDLLLQGGFLREAYSHLQHMAEEAAADTDLAFAMVTLGLSQRNLETAEAWMELIAQGPTGPDKFVRLGNHCQTARYDQKAAEFFQHALTHGHYPEACLGLGRMEAFQQNKEQARAHFLAALDLHRPLGEKSSLPAPMVISVLNELNSLHDPVLDCKAWIAKIAGKPQTTQLTNVSFVIFAPNQNEAMTLMTHALQAMQPGLPPPSITWQLAPKERQPRGPVHQGIQYVLD